MNLQRLVAISLGVALLVIGSPPRSTAEPPPPPPKLPATRVQAEAGVGLRLHLLPAGKVVLGSPLNEPFRGKDEARRNATITHPFWISETEVSQGQYRVLIGGAPSSFSHCASECPVESVNWYEAAAFLNALSAKAHMDTCYLLEQCTGKLGGGCAGDVASCSGDYRCKVAKAVGPSCNGYRLPTEAEWEYAARAGETGAIPGGEMKVEGGVAHGLQAVAWYAGNSGVEYYGGAPCPQGKSAVNFTGKCGPHPSGTKADNAFGLRDMLGNVMEMVEDRSLGKEQVWTDVDAQATDPWGRNGDRIVIKGGSWLSPPGECRFAWRGATDLKTRSRALGFRVVRTDTSGEPVGQ